MNPNNIEDWVVLDKDKCLVRAVRKQNKWDRTTNKMVLDYQHKQLKEALSFVHKFNIAIDAGANYGLMSYHMNMQFKVVHSFEIEPNVRECLKINVSNLNLKNVIVHDCGLGDKEDLVSLQYQKDSFGTRVDPQHKGGNIPIKTIDSFSFIGCDFIKIDCEGYEPHILKGSEQTIKSFHPVILMEDKSLSADYGINGKESIMLLQKWGYKIVKQFKKDCIMIYGKK